MNEEWSHWVTRRFQVSTGAARCATLANAPSPPHTLFPRNLTKDTNIFLRFKNPQLEQSYAVYREPYSSLPLLAALLVQCIDVLYSYLVLPRSTLHFINIAAPLVPIAMLVAISIAESFSGMLPKFFVDVSKRFNDITFVRELAAIIIALTIGLSNVIDMVCATHTHRNTHTHAYVLKSLY